jgi:predicted 3-demethylubiquinone-9 3-methyltransferase (glyoxalase superfamily)
MVKSVTPFLMFEGTAEAAMTFYVSLFPDAEIRQLVRFGPGEQGPEGSVMRSRLAIAGQEVMCFDSPVKHAFGFTPAVSLFVECGSEEELTRLAAGLGDGGSVLMPLDNYGFSRKFTWLNDRFGVSWQLNLA